MCNNFSSNTTLYHSFVVDLLHGIRTDSNKARLIPKNKISNKKFLRLRVNIKQKNTYIYICKDRTQRKIGNQNKSYLVGKL